MSYSHTAPVVELITDSNGKRVPFRIGSKEFDTKGRVTRTYFYQKKIAM